MSSSGIAGLGDAQLEERIRINNARLEEQRRRNQPPAEPPVQPAPQVVQNHESNSQGFGWKGVAVLVALAAGATYIACSSSSNDAAPRPDDNVDVRRMNMMAFTPAPGLPINNSAAMLARISQNN